jgi:hypothetical protein
MFDPDDLREVMSRDYVHKRAVWKLKNLDTVLVPDEFVADAKIATMSEKLAWAAFRKNDSDPITVLEMFGAFNEAVRAFSNGRLGKQGLSKASRQLFGFEVVFDPALGNVEAQELIPGVCFSFGDDVRVVIITRRELTVDGVCYGEVLRGSTVTIQPEAVLINGDPRDPFGI